MGEKSVTLTMIITPEDHAQVPLAPPHPGDPPPTGCLLRHPAPPQHASLLIPGPPMQLYLGLFVSFIYLF